MKCEKTSEITTFLKGETPETERETLRSHFDQCAICGQEIAKFDGVLKALGKMESVDPSPGFKWRVREAFLQAHPEFLEAPKRQPMTFWDSLKASFGYVPAWAISVAAHVFLLAVAAMIIFSPRSPEEERDEAALQAKPRASSANAPEFNRGGGGGKGRPERLGHIAPNDPNSEDFTPGPTRGVEAVIRAKDSVPNVNREKAEASHKLWRETIPRERRLLGFFDGRTTESQRRTVREAFGGQGTEKAIRAALDWLGRNQQPDGRWAGPAVRQEQAPDFSYSVGLTGLSLLAYLAEGQTTKTGDYVSTVRKGVEFLMSEQRASGLIGSDQGNYMYNHAIAALALLECAMATRDEQIGAAASAAVAFTVSAQNQTGGWGYTSRSIENDTSVGGWQILLLRFAKLQGNQGVIPALVAAYGRLQAMTDSEGKVGYRGRLQFPNGTHGLTAVGMLSHQLATHTPDPEVLAKQAGVLLERSPIPGTDGAFFMMNDLYFAYFGSLAMHQHGGEAWTQWWSPLRDKLLKTQQAEGSWPAAFDRWHVYGGQVYTTALSVLILETPVRYPRLSE